jgi:hypothetical protein
VNVSIFDNYSLADLVFKSMTDHYKTATCDYYPDIAMDSENKRNLDNRREVFCQLKDGTVITTTLASKPGSLVCNDPGLDANEASIAKIPKLAHSSYESTVPPSNQSTMPAMPDSLKRSATVAVMPAVFDLTMEDTVEIDLTMDDRKMSPEELEEQSHTTRRRSTNRRHNSSISQEESDRALALRLHDEEWGTHRM